MLSPSSTRRPSAIIKHANPCGVASADTLAEGLGQGAFAAIRFRPFGGIVAANRTLDAAAAEKIAAIFTEVIIAPDADEAAKAVGRAQEEPAPAADRRPARPRRARSDCSAAWRAAFWRRPATTAGLRRRRLKVVTKRAPTHGGAGRPAVRLPRLQAREVERHRLCQGRLRRSASAPGR